MRLPSYLAYGSDVLVALAQTLIGYSRRNKAGSNFLSAWRQVRFLNARHDGFLMDGHRKALSRKASFQNVLVLGKVGTGKSTHFAMPNLYHLQNASMVVLDTSGEIYAQTAGDLQRRGFDLQVLDLMSLTQGMRYNPLAACKDSLDRHKVCDSIIRAAGLNAGDRFWDAGAIKVLRVLASVLSNEDPKLCNLVNIRSLLARFDGISAPAGQSVRER
mgnify:FL=1